MILAITGHRPPKVGGYEIPNLVYEAVMRGMDEALLALRPEAVITGMALGVDQWMAELCIINDIPFVAAIPFDGFDSKWPDASRTHFRRLLSRAHDVHVVSPGAPYDSRLLQIRNVWMVRQSHGLLAVYNGSPGGTANCIRAARNYGKEVIVIPLPDQVWQIAKRIEGELDARSTERRVYNHERAMAEQERIEAIAREGRASRRRRAQLAEPVEVTVTEPAVPSSVAEDMAKMRADLNERIRVASQMPTELLDKDRAERVVVERAQHLQETAEYSESLMPKRVIEVGDD
jgi:uncharacterized phage-like protein YoqJ